jgi:dTMP kinase
MENKNLFFVFEGGDGSGKATQTKKTVHSLKELGHDVLQQEFPRYGHPGAFVTEQYLGKHYGKLPPESATILYTVDRFDAYKTEIEPAFNEGKIVVSDRWITSNKGHQAGKGKTPEERKKIVEYINYIEHEIMGLPKATQTYYLDVHPLLGQQLAGIGKNTKIDGKDLHEEDINHLLDARQAYREVAHNEGWYIVNCMQAKVDSYTQKDILRSTPEELFRTRDDIHAEIMEDIKKYM